MRVDAFFFLKQMNVGDYLKYGTYTQSVKNATNTCGSINLSSDLLTLPQERLTGVKFGQEIHRDRDSHSLHCVYIDWDLKTC